MNSRQWMGDDNRDSLAPNPDKPVRLGFPKGPTRKQLKAKADRHEAAIIKLNRAICVERDGYCAAAQKQIPGCDGPQEMAHLPPRTRAHTRNMPPEYRHDPSYVAILCARHHDMLDGRRHPRLVVKFLTDQGMNGPHYFDVERG